MLTIEKNIKRARRFHAVDVLLFKLLRPFKKLKHKEIREEMMVETDHGAVRTLWYGFDNEEITPVFFDLHGGGFVVGHADMDEAMNIAFHGKTGCKVISIDYAKAPDHPFPVALNQIYSFARHIHENADKYFIDAGRMAIGGHSAGANLSTVTCMKAAREGRFQFVCQVLDYPPLDLATNPYEKPRPKGSLPPKMMLMFNDSYVDPREAKHPYVSPVYASPGDLEGLPPAIFILAGKDSLHDEGLLYHNMLKDAGVETACHEYPDARHGFTYMKLKDAADAIEKMAEFLDKYLN